MPTLVTPRTVLTTHPTAPAGDGPPSGQCGRCGAAAQDLKHGDVHGVCSCGDGVAFTIAHLDIGMEEDDIARRVI